MDIMEEEEEELEEAEEKEAIVGGCRIMLVRLMRGGRR
jgi:hypothetical protein